MTITSAGYCTNITEAGTYFPILRVSDWATRKNEYITNPVVRAFIYLFGVLFILLGFACLYQMVVALYAIIDSGILNLGFFLFIFMFFFDMVRGLYLIILPSGRLENNIAAQYFLAELPQFLFFSVYSIIIFCWAEVGMTVNYQKSFLQYFKWPFITTNVGLYVLFIVMVSIFQNESVQRQKQLKEAYVIILAICCVLAVGGFNIFGKKLLTIQMRASSLKTEGNNSTMRKMAIIMVVSSITIITQIIFLFVVTYSSVSPGAGLVAYVLTEILPSATLLITLRPISRKLARGEAGTSSTEMKGLERSNSNHSRTDMFSSKEEI